MCKPMTDERLEELFRLIKTPGDSVIYDSELDWLIREVRRLRAEAIVWHPWGGEKPEVLDLYLVTFENDDGDFVEIMRYIPKVCKWEIERNGEWKHFCGSSITAWTEMIAPYGGE